MIKKIFLLFLIAILGSAAIAYFKPELIGLNLSEPQSSPNVSKLPNKPDIVFKTPQEIFSVLGAATEKAVDTTTGLVDKLTNEQEEALINSTVDNISKQVKGLPQEQVKKVKQEFCKDILEEGATQ